MNVVVHQGALGDFVLLGPVLAALGQLGPTHLVTHAAHGRLAARLLPNLQAHDADAPRWSALFADDAQVHPDVAAVLSGAARIVSFVSDGRDAWARNVRRLAGQATLHAVTPRPPADYRGHVTQWHAEQLQRQGWARAWTAPATRPGQVQHLAADVLVHPGSGGLDKCWPVERYAALVAMLRKRGLAVRVVMGEAEAARGWVNATESRWSTNKPSGPEGRGLGGRVCATLDELVEEMNQASVYVGNDAGPTHLAAALGLSVVALFGPSDALQWAPVGRAVRVLAPPSPRAMTWLDVATVLDAVTC
jgi:hypothetical protein